MVNAEDHRKCREDLARELRVQSIPDEVWDVLVKERTVYYAITGGDRQELADEAQKLLKIYRAGSAAPATPPGRGGERGAPPEIVVNPSKDILERAQAFSEVAATLADKHPEVKKMRKRYLRGRLLSDDEARACLDKHGGPQYRLGPFWEKLLDKLVKTYRWREGDALWFVLTGHTPPVRPLEVRVSPNNTSLYARHNVIERAHGNQPARNRPTERVRDYHPDTARITVTADAWVDAREIERAFRDAQRQILGGDAKTRRDKRTLEAVKFVARRMREHGEETWEERLRAWNKTYPKWCYGSYSGLRQVFERFVHPTYNLPKHKPPDLTPYQAYRSDWVRRVTGEADTS